MKDSDFIYSHYYAYTSLVDELLKNPNHYDEQWYEDLFCQLDPQFDSEEFECLEPLCFVVVSDLFGRFLKREGEAVTNEFGFWLWGRTTCGQQISCDHVAKKFCEEYNR